MKLSTTAFAPWRLSRMGIAGSFAGRNYIDHSRGNGTALYRLACQLDLEGIGAKRADSLYGDDPNVRNWIKVKNPAYSQKEGRGDLFKRAG